MELASLTLLVYELFSVLSSQDGANSIGVSEIVAVSVLAYFLARLVVRAPMPAAWLTGSVALGGAWLGSTAVLQFSKGTQRIASIGLTDFVAFRSRFMQIIPGWVPGECFTLLLLALAFAYGVGVYVIWRARASKAWSGLVYLALLPAVPILAALLLSLSRAVFWSTLFFFVAACGLMAAYKVVTLRTASIMLAGCCGTLVLILFCEASLLYPGIFRAYTGGHVSQTRSTEGRIETWERSLKVMHDHPAWGVGSSNAALFLLSSADEEDTTGFTSRTFSLPVQILVEKGLIGFALYSAFLVAVFWEFHRNMRPSSPQAAVLDSARAKQPKKGSAKSQERDRLQMENAHRAMKCIFAAGLAAVLLRELTYSSLLEHTATLALAFTLAALMCAPAKPEPLKIKPLAIAVAVIVLAFQWPYWSYAQANSRLKDFYADIAAAHFTTALESIDGAIRLWPWNARLYGWRGYVESQELPSQCLGMHGAGLSDRGKRAAMAAADDYRHSLRLNDRDAVAHHDLAWLEHLLGDNADASRDWKESVDLDPDNAAFHVSYGMFLDETREGDAARAQYEAAIELTPSILDSQFLTRFKSKSPQAADSVVNAAISRLKKRLGSGNDPILEARLGKLYLFEGDTAQSERMLTDASRQLPNLPLVWFNLGQLYEDLGDTEAARTDFDRARVIDSSLAGPYLQLAELTLRDGEKRQAAQYFEQTIQRWQRVNPVTSAHNNRLYDGPRQPIDDLLPTTLVWYISPCEASEAWRGLSELRPQERAYAQRDRTCEQLPSPHLGASQELGAER